MSQAELMVGDKVKYIGEDCEGLYINTKEVYTIKSITGNFLKLEEVTLTHGYYKSSFERIPSEKDQTSAWLKENPWYITVNGKQEFLAAVKWLEDHSQVAELSNTWLDGVESLRSSNNMSNTYIRTDMTCVSKEKEIILNFKVIVESVKLPETPKPTEQELRIIELEATISKAQEQVKKIKEEM